MSVYHKFVGKSFYILFVAVVLFSSTHGRPKDNADIVEMRVDEEAQEQVQPPEFGSRNNGEESQDPVSDDNVQETEENGPPEDPEGDTPILNVHDARSRAVADYLKSMPFQAGDTEEIMHGGGHVHGEGHEGVKKAVGVAGAGLEDLMGGEKEEEEGKGAPSTIDTEQLMHGGQEGEHGHNPHQGGHQKAHGPTAENPEDLLHMRDMELKAEELSQREPGAVNPEASAHKMDVAHHKQGDDNKRDGDGKKMGVSIEEVVHGDGHEHDHEIEVTEEFVDEDGVTHKRKLGKQITFEDIQNLGLSKRDLEGIDLSKLLRRDQSEYENWKEAEQKDKGFWERVDEFRSNYFNMLSKQIRHLSRGNNDDDNDDDFEWEFDDGNDEPHPGESRVDHESELWGSTNPKGKRRRRTFTVIRRQTHDGTDEL